MDSSPSVEMTLSSESSESEMSRFNVAPATLPRDRVGIDLRRCLLMLTRRFINYERSRRRACKIG